MFYSCTRNRNSRYTHKKWGKFMENVVSFVKSLTTYRQKTNLSCFLFD